MHRFRKLAPWAAPVLALLAIGAIWREARELHRDEAEIALHKATIADLGAKLQDATHPLYHRHADVKIFMIRAALADAVSPIVILGDSITEMARLPLDLCGHPVINAGIGGMSINEATALAPSLFDGVRPFMVVSALGGNDIGSAGAGSNYAALLAALAKVSDRLIAVSVIPDDAVSDPLIAAAAGAREVPYVDTPLPPHSKLSDHIHFNWSGYRAWWAPLQSAILKECA